MHVRKITLAALALAASACATPPAWKPELKPLPAVQVGVTTYQELERDAGQPWRLLLNFDGSYRAIYIAHENEARVPHTYRFDRAGRLIGFSVGEDETGTRTAMNSANSVNGAM